MRKQIIVSVAMGLAMTTVATTTWAQEVSGGWYFGVTGGQAKADLDQDELDELVFDTFDAAGAPVVDGSSDLDDSDTSFSLFGGYRISRYFAVEAGYIDFGTAEYRSSGIVDPLGPQTPQPASYSADLEVKGFTAAAVGTLPLNQMFELHARLGVLFADTEISETAAISTTSLSDSFSADSQDLFYGVGAGFHLGQNWTFSLEWQQYKDVGDEDETGETDIDRVSLGVIFKL